MNDSNFVINESDAFVLYIFKYLQENRNIDKLNSSKLQKEIASTFEAVNRGKTRSYSYSVIDKMKAAGWIESAGSSNLQITIKGKEHRKSLKNDYVDNLLELKSKATHFYQFINHDGKVKHTQLSKNQKKMFSRLMDIRSLTTFLIIHKLSENSLMSGTEILKQINAEHLWQPSNGYFFDIIRELETDRHFVSGEWTNARRRKYLYGITTEGTEAIHFFANKSKESLIKLLQYTNFCLDLFIK